MTTHRIQRSWRRVAGAGLLTAAAALVVATWPSAASADPAVRTAWWNTVSGGGQSAPSPTTADGGLHIAVAPGQILAFGAVLYNLPVDATATIELKLSAQGTPVLQACPTKDVSWKDGGDQSSDTAPAYDCSLHAYNGNISADGTTATFLVDGSADTAPGQLSLAIVPYMTHDAPAGVGTELPVDATQPFTVDIAKPDATSLQITSGVSSLSSGGGSGGTTSGGSQPPPATQSTGQTGSTTPPSMSQPAITPPSSGQVATPTDNAPQVAPPAGTTTPMQPAASGLPAPATNNTAHNVALALLVLVAMVVVSSGSPAVQRAPRLLGGRHAVGAPAAAATAAAIPITLMGVRGLGRFAKARQAPPRPLV